MKKVKGIINTGFVGCEHEVEFMVEDDATESDINEYIYGKPYIIIFQLTGKQKNNK